MEREEKETRERRAKHFVLIQVKKFIRVSSESVCHVQGGGGTNSFWTCVIFPNYPAVPASRSKPRLLRHHSQGEALGAAWTLGRFLGAVGGVGTEPLQLWLGLIPGSLSSALKCAQP